MTLNTHSWSVNPVICPDDPPKHARITCHTTGAGQSNEESRTRVITVARWHGLPCRFTLFFYAPSINTQRMRPAMVIDFNAMAVCSRFLRTRSLGVTGIPAITCHRTWAKTSSRRGCLSQNIWNPEILKVQAVALERWDDVCVVSAASWMALWLSLYPFITVVLQLCSETAHFCI